MNNQKHKFTDAQRKQMIAYEAFLRRAAASELPFMLKGSFITRQYFPEHINRLTNDLDWVCLEPLTDVGIARELLNRWMLAITHQTLNDGVRFKIFTETPVWESLDYAMHDDFPTVSAAVVCWVDGEMVELTVDVSLNLHIDYPPVSITYYPLRGESFILEKTAPLSLQVAWKIHQCLIGIRIKDLFDLTYLVQHPSFDQMVQEQALKALINECHIDNIDLNRLKAFWEYDITKTGYQDTKEFIQIFDQFKQAMISAGFNTQLMANLPEPDIHECRLKLNAPIDQLNTPNIHIEAHETVIVARVHAEKEHSLNAITKSPII